MYDIRAAIIKGLNSPITSGKDLALHEIAGIVGVKVGVTVKTTEETVEPGFTVTEFREAVLDWLNMYKDTINDFALNQILLILIANREREK